MNTAGQDGSVIQDLVHRNSIRCSKCLCIEPFENGNCSHCGTDLSAEKQFLLQLTALRIAIHEMERAIWEGGPDIIRRMGVTPGTPAWKEILAEPRIKAAWDEITNPSHLSELENMEQGFNRVVNAGRVWLITSESARVCRERSNKESGKTGNDPLC